MTQKIFRIFLLPFGLVIKFFEMASVGARDIHNKLRFKNSIIDKNCKINSDCALKDKCHVLENSILNNTEVDRFSYVGRNCLIQNAKIGSFCSIANDVIIGLGKHPLSYFSTSPLFYKKRNTFNYPIVKQDLEFDEYELISIGSDVWIGARAIILDGVEIGHGAIIAANSLVNKNVPPYSIVGGIPAKVIKYRFTDEIIEKLLHEKWWEWEIHRIIREMPEVITYAHADRSV
jgi:acetyltransferase-like isoleucine patch superfamily enzyme